jgi:dTDP-4-dehydrorhamnose 3,5-epimerase
MIDGVKVKKLRVIPDERGRLMEILRSDEEIYEKFGQIYITAAYPGVVKAWHYHREQTDHLVCVSGMMKIVLYDARESSSTNGEVNEFFCGIHNPLLIKVPKGIYHGFKCISDTEALVINIPDKLYDYDSPDEFRVDPHKNDIPYDWARKDG